MKRPRYPAVVTLLVGFLMVFAGTFEVLAAAPQTGDRLTVAGVMKNPQGRGVPEVEVEMLVNGQHVKAANSEEIATGKSGSFLAEFILPGRDAARGHGGSGGFQAFLEKACPDGGAGV